MNKHAIITSIAALALVSGVSTASGFGTISAHAIPEIAAHMSEIHAIASEHVPVYVGPPREFEVTPRPRPFSYVWVPVAPHALVNYRCDPRINRRHCR